jgi:hypothetical protein
VAVTHEGTAQSERALARAQSLMREVNEQIHQLHTNFSDIDVRTILCECGSDECLDPIEITLDQYQLARRFPTRFLLVPGHERLERVVEEHDHYLVVENSSSEFTPSILDREST